MLSALRNLQIGTWVVITAGTFLLALLSALAIRQTMQPINSLTETATAIAAGDLSRVAPIESVDEFGFLAESFNRMTEQLLEFIGNLEQRVAERTKALEARSRQLEAAAEVGRSASSILDVNELIRNTVGLIRERFDLYYVGLFLTDENQEFAILQAGTGEAGQRMLARRHMIRIGEGMIGWTVAFGLPRVAAEVGEDAVRQATAELPDTRSEAAIPLRSRGRVIGALTVQSVRPGEFDESIIAVLQTMADLVSVAIDNARLYTETETALQSIRRVYSELSQEDWMNLLQTKTELSFRSDQSGTKQVSNVWSPYMEQAWVKNSTVVTSGDQLSPTTNQIAIPIRVRGNVIGVLQTQKSSDSGTWTEDERLMLETVIEQLGVALDSARLFEDTQRRAMDERLIAEVSSSMRETLDIDTILQSAIREIGNKLNLSEVEIRLGNTPSQNGSDNSG
jgi:GAF domain-containing protein/HAMP domain-containing protein